MRVKLDKADLIFSRYVRLRDGRCVFCGKPGEPTKKGKIGGLQASHYFGRGRESVRFDPENVDAVCFADHVRYGSEDREGYRQFKVNQLGEKGYQALVVRANTYAKKDRKMSYLIAKGLLDGLKEN